MVAKVPHHIEMLLTEFSRRKVKNPRYSLRAYAKSLGMSSATLSRILSLNQEISLDAAKKIIKKLKYTDFETMVFIRSIADEKCQRTYSILSTKLESNIYPHEKNVLFISDLDQRCIFLNDVAVKLNKDCLDRGMEKVFQVVGFENEVANFASNSIKKAASSGIARKHHLPLHTSVGKLTIESIFTPLFGRDGEVSAVASVLLNLSIDVLKAKGVSLS